MAVRQYAGQVPDHAGNDLGLDVVKGVIRRAQGYAFKRAMEPPFPQSKIY